MHTFKIMLQPEEDFNYVLGIIAPDGRIYFSADDVGRFLGKIMWYEWGFEHRNCQFGDIDRGLNFMRKNLPMITQPDLIDVLKREHPSKAQELLALFAGNAWIDPYNGKDDDNDYVLKTGDNADLFGMPFLHWIERLKSRFR